MEEVVENPIKVYVKVNNENKIILAEFAKQKMEEEQRKLLNYLTKI